MCYVLAGSKSIMSLYRIKLNKLMSSDSGIIVLQKLLSIACIIISVFKEYLR